MKISKNIKKNQNGCDVILQIKIRYQGKNTYVLLKFLCRCKNGHYFDFRKRVLYPPDDKHHAPCQGKCPICGNPQLSMIDENRYPVPWNYIGGHFANKTIFFRKSLIDS